MVASPRIALVDDDLSVRRALPRLLRSAGYEVRAFSSAQELLDSGFAGEAACMVVDIHLGGMSGLEMVERLRGASGDVPVIFITAHDDPASRERARRVGACAYLRKPFEASVLLVAVSQATAGPEHPSEVPGEGMPDPQPMGPKAN
jgi:FixJ family two-component response regulator